MTTGLGPKSGDIAFRKDFAFDKRVRLQKTQGLFLKHEIPVRMEGFFWVERGSFLSLLAFLLFIVSKELVFSRVCFILDYRRQMLSGAAYKEGQVAT